MSPTEPAEGRGGKRGCLLLVISAVLVPLLVLVGVLGYQAYTLYQLTSPSGVPVPIYTPAPGQTEGVEKRLNEFERDGGPPHLELEADDINTLISGTDEGRRYAGKVFVRIEGDQILADVSLPLSELKIRAISDRYLNGTVVLKVRHPEKKASKTKEQEDDAARLGKLSDSLVYVDCLSAAGRQLPESYLSHLRDHNLLLSLPPDVVSKLVEKVKAIEVKGGKIVLERSDRVLRPGVAR